MKLSFIKFLSGFALVSMSLVGNSGLNLCYAMDSETVKSTFTQNDKQDLEMNNIRIVREEYIQTYDETTLKDNGKRSLMDTSDRDCKYLEADKKMDCRHFSNCLIEKLRAKGIQSYPLYVTYKNSSVYQVVLYKAGNSFFVADIAKDILAVQKKEPKFYAMKLDDFIEEILIKLKEL